MMPLAPSLLTIEGLEQEDLPLKYFGLLLHYDPRFRVFLLLATVKALLQEVLDYAAMPKIKNAVLVKYILQPGDMGAELAARLTGPVVRQRLGTTCQAAWSDNQVVVALVLLTQVG